MFQINDNLVIYTMLKTFMAEPVIFSLLGGTSSILRTFRAETVKKKLYLASA